MKTKTLNIGDKVTFKSKENLRFYMENEVAPDSNQSQFYMTKVLKEMLEFAETTHKVSFVKEDYFKVEGSHWCWGYDLIEQ